MKLKKSLVFLLIAAVIVILPFMDQEKEELVKASEELTTEEVNETATLEEKLDAILSDERLDGAVTGVNVRKADTGEILFSRNGDTVLHPASNMKLLTGIAAMETLGADYKFLTEVWTDGTIRGKVLHGNVYVKGKGDPTLMKEDLDQFAQDLQDLGIHKIKGSLFGDDTWYDDVRLSQDLNWSDEPFYTGAQVSALTLAPDTDYDAGTVIIEVIPKGKVGEKAEVTVTPETDYVTIVNNTEVVAESDVQDISVEREHGTNTIIVKGTMPIDGSNSKSWTSVWEPTGYAMDVFKKSLEENGISFAGKSEIQFDATPENATLLTSKDSIPLKELFTRFMKLSNNGHGETLTKEMGKVVHGEGSWDKGLEVIEEVVTDLGVDGDAILLRDGSGMSHKTYIPANAISHLLYAIQEKNWYPTFERTLPVAGDPERFVGGTLRNRMTEEPAKGNVKAKTGSLTSVSTLSGYVTSQNEEKLIFSILINNYLGSSASEIEDEIAIELAKHK